MAERFREQVDIRPVRTDTGQAHALMSLVDRLENFKNFAYKKAVEIGTERAVTRGVSEAEKVQLEEVDGITKAPEFKEKRFIGGVEINAYNKTLRNAYLASLDNDNREALAKIASENPDDLIAFNDASEAYKKGVVKSVDPSVRAMVQQDLDQKITDHGIRVQAADVKKNKESAEAEIEFSAKSLLDESTVYAREGNLIRSAEKLQDVFAVYAGQLEAGVIDETEFKLKKRKAELDVTKQAIVGGVKENLRTGDFRSAIESLIRFREKTPKGMTIEEHEDVITAVKSEINETILLNNKLEDTQKTNNTKNQNLMYARLFSDITTGVSNSQDVLNALNSRKITTEQASKLIGTINTRGQGVDDWALVNMIQDGMRTGQDMSSTIIANAGTNLTDGTASDLLIRNDQSLDEESLLNKSSVKRAEGYIVQSLKVTGPFGALDQEAEKRLARAKRQYAERVLAGENEWDIADELVGKDEFETAMSPKYGSKENLDEALKLLNEAVTTGVVDKETYNFEYRNIERLIQLRDNISAFDKAKKESENANKRQ